MDRLGDTSIMDSWNTISADDYRFASECSGGSFAAHPRVASLSKRPVQYAGLMRKGEFLEFYRQSRLIDIRASAVVLPIAEDVRIRAPATYASSLHANNIVNVEPETPFRSRLAKRLLTLSSRARSAVPVSLGITTWLLDLSSV
jgi:hypothetical protein